MTHAEKLQLDRDLETLMTRTWEVNGQEINLARRGWTYGYNNRKTAFGVCRARRRRVELSRAFINAEGSSYDKMNDTIRHEIAHALDFEVRGTSDHSRAWKRICVVTGADPRATHHTDAKPKGRYEAVCPTHGVVHYFHRKPSRSYLCKCRKPITIRDTKS